MLPLGTVTVCDAPQHQGAAGPGQLNLQRYAWGTHVYAVQSSKLLGHLSQTCAYWLLQRLTGRIGHGLAAKCSSCAGMLVLVQELRPSVVHTVSLS